MKDKEDSPRLEAFVDVLVPAYISRARENVQVGEDLFTTEVPGLQLALARPPVTITLELRRLNGEILQCELPFPDEVSALVLKSLATTVQWVRLSEGCVIPGCFGHAMRPRSAILAGS